MKLVDILARELKEWPEGCSFCVQDYDHEVRFSPSTRHDFYAEELADRDQESAAKDGIPHAGKVTRAQWQAAVDALKAGEQTWDGEGLPPVGAKVRIGNFPGNKWLENFQGREAVIIAHNVTQSGEASAVFKTFADNGYPRYHALAYEEGNFLPIRTAEQIAAEERALGVKQIADHLFQFAPELDRKAIAECFYDAGYRKQVQP